MKYISTSIFLLVAQKGLSFILPENHQSVLSVASINGNVEDVFSSLEQRLERKIDRLVETLDHVEVNQQKETKIRHPTQAVDYTYKEYAAAFSAMSMDNNHYGHGRHGGHGRYRDYPGGHDDTDPEDGTDPGDGPPYYRSPKEPPHHTPSPPEGIPHVPRPRMPPNDRKRPHKDSTVWDLISSSKYTTRFYELIKEDRDIMNMMKDKNSNITVFAPCNAAFEKLDRLRKDHNMSKDMIHRVLLYHISRGTHWSEDLCYRNTLTTMLPEKELGNNMHQRVRIGLGYHGPTVNFYSEFTMLDIFAQNGVIHGVDAVLLPPPDILDLLLALPTEFSTTLTAFTRAGLLNELTKLGGHGSTVFAPSNRDWQKLGFMINAFLFSERGKPYLRALMKYHIVAGRTLYSDALLVPDKDKSKAGTDNEYDDAKAMAHGYFHADLPTMLEGKHISVDVTRLERFMSFRMNGLTSIIISDGIAKSGCIQVPDHIMLPPHSMKEHRDPPKMLEKQDENVDETQEGSYGVYTVADLKAALEPFVEQERAELEKLEGFGSKGDAEL